jgi:two-component system chemotaxis response regulator CheY
LEVLIAEPDISYSKSLETDINEWGYEAICAHNSQEALEAVEKNDIRLVLIDWSTGGLNALVLCHHIRQQIQDEKTKNKYIILMVPKGVEYDIIKGINAGADDYIIKPFNFYQLKVRLQNAARTMELEDNCIKLSSYDLLTKLWNKKKIVEILEEELKRGWRENHPIGVIMVDIDNFKEINDTHGHFIGDKVLAEVAARFKKNMRPHDRAGRYGGDEMLIVLPNIDLNGLKETAERLRHVIMDKDITTELASIEVKISLGGTYSNNLTQVSSTNLIQISDKALYQAKNQGRNQSVIVEFFSSPEGEQQ